LSHRACHSQNSCHSWLSPEPTPAKANTTVDILLDKEAYQVAITLRRDSARQSSLVGANPALFEHQAWV
ncbi:MAG: hypothetical protein AB8G99_14535, partial [Planctomycetaceae bacterium]